MKSSILEVKSVRVTERGQIAIPKTIRTIQGFNVGSKLAVVAFEDRIELRPMKQLSDSMLTAIASEKSLAKEWNSKEEDEAWNNL